MKIGNFYIDPSAAIIIISIIAGVIIKLYGQ